MALPNASMESDREVECAFIGVSSQLISLN